MLVRCGMDADLDDGLVVGHVDAGIDLVGYAGGTSPVDEQHLIEAHLRSCTACEAAVAELRATLVILEIGTLEID